MRALAFDESWWEIRVQLVLACGQLLSLVPPSEIGPPDGAFAMSIRQCVNIVDTILAQDCGVIILRAAISFCVDALANYPALIASFIMGILDIPFDDRVRMLDTEAEPEQLPLQGVSGSIYRLPALPTRWPAKLVADTLVDMISRKQLDQLEDGHLQIMVALLRPDQVPGEADGSGEGKEAERQDHGSGPEWRVSPELEDAVFNPLRDYVLAALISPGRTQRLASEIVTLVAIFGTAGPALLEDDLFVRAIDVAVGGDASTDGKTDPDVLSGLEQWLERLADHSVPTSIAVKQLLNRCWEHSGELIERNAAGLVALKQTLESIH